VYYSLNAGKEKRVVMRDANNNLSLDGKGVYRITKVGAVALPFTRTKLTLPR
jgi:hypothetical protein